MQKADDRAQGKIEFEYKTDCQGNGQRNQHLPAHAKSSEIQEVHSAPEQGRHYCGSHPALFETAGNIDRNQQHGIIKRAQGLVGQIRANLGADNFQALNFGRIVGKGLLQGLDNRCPQLGGIGGFGF